MSGKRIIDERPLDFLSKAKFKNVLIELKNGEKYRGVLQSFDIHINIVLKDAEQMVNGEVKRRLGTTFFRGDTIILISFK